jgi:hypothetical protein
MPHGPAEVSEQPILVRREQPVELRHVSLLRTSWRRDPLAATRGRPSVSCG